MSDILLETVRLLPLVGIYVLLLNAGRQLGSERSAGWWYLIGGFGLILFASIIDVTDNFESLNKYVVIGDTEVQAFLEKVVGYLGGFVLLSIGFWKWIPKIVALQTTTVELQATHKKMQKTNKKLSMTVNELRKKIAELEKINSLTVNRELKMAELKKEIKNLKKPSDT